MEPPEPQLIPYASAEELHTKVHRLLYGEGPSFPQIYQYRRTFDRYGEDYYPDAELHHLMKLLPAEHPIIREIISQASEFLDEIASKSTEYFKTESKKWIDQHRFDPLEVVGSRGYEELFPSVQRASYHVLKEYPLTDDVPPAENDIIHIALAWMRGYAPTRRQQVEEFLDAAWAKKASPANTIEGYIECSSKRAVPCYFELLGLALKQGAVPTREEVRGKMAELFEHDLIIDGIKKPFNFKYTGRHLSRAFPGYPFWTYYNDLRPALSPQVTEFLDEKVFKA